MKNLVLFLFAIIMLLSACGQGNSIDSAPGSGENGENLSWQEQYDLGVRYLSEGDYQEAIIAFTAAIEIDPKLTDAYIGRGDAFIGIATMSITDADILTEEAEVSYRSALDDYLAAIERDESNADIYIKVADVYITLGNADGAVEILRRGFETTGSDILSRRLEEMVSAADEDDLSEADMYGDLIPLNVTGTLSLSDVNYLTEIAEDGEERIRLFFTVDGPDDAFYFTYFIFGAVENSTLHPEQIDFFIHDEAEPHFREITIESRDVPYRVSTLKSLKRGSLYDVLAVAGNEQGQAVGYALIRLKIP